MDLLIFPYQQTKLLQLCKQWYGWLNAIAHTINYLIFFLMLLSRLYSFPYAGCCSASSIHILLLHVQMGAWGSCSHKVIVLCSMGHGFMCPIPTNICRKWSRLSCETICSFVYCHFFSGSAFHHSLNAGQWKAKNYQLICLDHVQKGSTWNYIGHTYLIFILNMAIMLTTLHWLKACNLSITPETLRM